MATAAPSGSKEQVFEWQGKDRNGKIARGEMRAMGETRCRHRCGARASPAQIKKHRISIGKKITLKDLAIFTRQLATMMKAGVPFASGL